MSVEQRQFLGYARVASEVRPISQIPELQNYTFTAENIFALIAFITSVWMLVYMGWVVHGLRVVPRFTNTLLACCGRKYSDVYYVSWFFDRGDR